MPDAKLVSLGLAQKVQEKLKWLHASEMSRRWSDPPSKHCRGATAMSAYQTDWVVGWAAVQTRAAKACGSVRKSQMNILAVNPF